MRRTSRERGPSMRTRVGGLLALVVMLLLAGRGQAQTVGEVFDRVVPSVAVIRASGREVTAQSGTTSSFRETGSGVLFSADGRIMTAAHVVHAMDEIEVQFLGSDP